MKRDDLAFIRQRPLNHFRLPGAPHGHGAFANYAMRPSVSRACSTWQIAATNLTGR